MGDLIKNKLTLQWNKLIVNYAKDALSEIILKKTRTGVKLAVSVNFNSTSCLNFQSESHHGSAGSAKTFGAIQFVPPKLTTCNKRIADKANANAVLCTNAQPITTATSYLRSIKKFWNYMDYVINTYWNKLETLQISKWFSEIGILNKKKASKTPITNLEFLMVDNL